MCTYEPFANFENISLFCKPFCSTWLLLCSYWTSLQHLCYRWGDVPFQLTLSPRSSLYVRILPQNLFYDLLLATQSKNSIELWAILDFFVFVESGLENPPSNLLALVAIVTVLRQGWDALLNCDYALQVLQQVATNDYKPNGHCITQTVKHGCACVHIVKQETATFQTKGPGSVLSCIIHTDVYNRDLRILNMYTCVGTFILHWHSP